jgi:hypothetical protein
MELFKSTSIMPQSSRPLVIIHIFPVLIGFLAMLLLLIAIVLILSTMIGFSIGNSALRSNPLTAYEGIWLGQPIASVAAYAGQTSAGSMTCYASNPPEHDYPYLDIYTRNAGLDESDKTIVCEHYPHDGVFGTVSLTMEGERVQELTFLSDRLQENTLLLYWGAPDAITRIGNTQGFWLRWVRSSYWAVAKVEPALPGAVVRILTITTKG